MENVVHTDESILPYRTFYRWLRPNYDPLRNVSSTVKQVTTEQTGY